MLREVPKKAKLDTLQLVAAVALEMKSPSSTSPKYLCRIFINGLFGLCHECYEDCPEIYTRTRSFSCGRDSAEEVSQSAARVVVS